MSACRSCSAEVVFAPSATSAARMILDAKVERRIVFEPRLLEWGTDGHGVQLYAKGDLAARVVDTYIDHHATCPDAASWRRKKRSA